MMEIKKLDKKAEQLEQQPSISQNELQNLLHSIKKTIEEVKTHLKN